MRDRPASRHGASVCGDLGYRGPVTWSTTAAAAELASDLANTPTLGNVTTNPHLNSDWARQAVTCGPIIHEVAAMIGAEIAVENAFLMIKWPGDQFTVPAHQDGINERIELDPARSVAIWLAVSEATAANGCLEVAPGSHQAGYLAYRRAALPAGRSGRPLTTSAGDRGTDFLPLPLAAGQAYALDVRLVHRSGPNTTTRPRIGLNIRYVAPGGWTVRNGPGPPLLPVAGDRW
jgi:ectoine hydroxylase-related dioxygenase (phytanoyl-CoA dioxygenase family)